MNLKLFLLIILIIYLNASEYLKNYNNSEINENGYPFRNYNYKTVLFKLHMFAYMAQSSCI